MKVDLAVPLKINLEAKLIKGKRNIKCVRGIEKKIDKDSEKSERKLEKLKEKLLKRKWKKRKEGISINLERENTWKQLIEKLKLSSRDKEDLFTNIIAMVPERENDDDNVIEACEAKEKSTNIRIQSQNDYKGTSIQ